MPQTAFNPYDPIQTNFLSALALGETGSNSNSSTEGYGGVNLSGAATDQWGFPIWSGASGASGTTHAAGTFQFEPGTWDSIAQQFGLNFANSSDQAAGAWYLAEQTYAQKTGGDLETALQSGNYSSVQEALAGVWPSVTGNPAAPAGLATDLTTGTGANISSIISSIIGNIIPGGAGGLGGAALNIGGTTTTAGINAVSGGLLGAVENWFVRGGLIIAAVLIILVALWMLLSNAGVVPSPKQVAKGATKAVGAAIAA